jgi:iron complex outermembrane recepter protein
VPVVPGDASGNDLPKAPHFTADLYLDYKLDLLGGRIDINSLYAYNSGYYLEADNMFRLPAFNMLNASASWTTRQERFAVRMWGKNLTNEAVIVAGATTALGTRSVHYDAPRTYGITFEFRIP